MEIAVTDVTVRFSDTNLGFGRLVALLRRSIGNAMMVRDVRCALDDLPDVILKDIGIARSDIPFVAGALVSRPEEAAVKLNWSDVEREPDLTARGGGMCGRLRPHIPSAAQP